MNVMNFVDLRLIGLCGILFLQLAQVKAACKDTDNESIQYTVCSHYKYRADKKPGRELLLTYNGEKVLKNAKLEIKTNQGSETVILNTSRKDSISIILPARVGVHKNDTVCTTLTIGKSKIAKTIIVPALRQWTVYIYPHSHVDIGYTNTQANVEIIHKRNLDNAIDLAEKTKNYPEGARYVWNPEVTWPVERYLKSETPQKKAKLLQAIKDGYISIDAGYVSTNTSASSDEELFELFRYGKYMEKETGKEVKTMVQVDIPGVSWGVVSTAAQLNIPYCLSLFNGYDRTGLAHELSFKPFWWVAPDGKSKVLFLQPGAYTPGALAKGKYFWPLMAGQTDPDKLLQIVKTDNPRANFIDAYLAEKLPELERADYYPYDIFPMTWCMADNTPIDADLPDAVKSWNEEFAFPRLIICSATEMMQAFDDKYGKTLPVLKGDFTEYWTDGLGTNAKQTGNHREVKERLVQTETLWSMLNAGKPAPRTTFEEAWRRVILGTEHTWAYMEPAKQPISDDILKVKFSHFEEADKSSRALLKQTLPEAPLATNTIAVFNTVSWLRSDVVIIPAKQSEQYKSVTDSNGKEVLSQRLSTGELAFMASDIPAFGSEKYTLSTKKSKFKGSFINGNTLDNGIVKVRLDQHTGDVINLVYKDKEFADQKATTSINSYRYLRGEDSPGKAFKDMNIKISVKEDGPLLATLTVLSEAEGCNSLNREVTLIAGKPHIELCNIVDKIAITNKEGIHFGFAFDVPNPTTKVDVPWGVMELEKDQLSTANRNWIALQRWLNISNNERGVTWCALNACSFESGDITANILGGAFGSPKWIRKLEPSATIYSWALNNHWHTNFSLSQQGIIKFRYSILPHDTKFDAAVSNNFGMEQIQPLLSSFVNADYTYESNFSIQADPTVCTSVIKTINNGKSTIIRLRSVSASDQTVQLNWKTKAPKLVSVCDFYEEASGKIVGSQVVVPAMGFITLRAEW